MTLTATTQQPHRNWTRRWTQPFCYKLDATGRDWTRNRKHAGQGWTRLDATGRRPLAESGRTRTTLYGCPVLGGLRRIEVVA
jgi:hypothetical protein